MIAGSQYDDRQSKLKNLHQLKLKNDSFGPQRKLHAKSACKIEPMYEATGFHI